MKAIKALVAFMGVLLIAGLGLMGYGFYSKAGQSGAKSRAPVVAAVQEGSFGTITVPVPAGGRIEQVLVAGQRVVLRVTGAGPERFIVLDPGDGTVAGNFLLTPEAPQAAR
jgi:hypothetical protein